MSESKSSSEGGAGGGLVEGWTQGVPGMEPPGSKAQHAWLPAGVPLRGEENRRS